MQERQQRGPEAIMNPKLLIQDGYELMTPETQRTGLSRAISE
jgi:hypothetical protein